LVSITWEAAGASDLGRMREGNEDAFHLDTERGVFVIADGMGGHAAGEVASALAVQSTAEALRRAVDHSVPPVEVPTVMAAAFQYAWQQIHQSSQSDPRTEGMGTTLTACLVSPDGWCRIGHIGDSRLYRFRDGALELLTQDHTWVQREIDSGRLQPEAAETHPFAHVLTRVLTADLPPEPDLIAASVLPGDVLLLSTDGLHGLVPAEQLHAAVTRNEPLSTILSRLVTAANERGGRDNITALIVRAHAHDAPATRL
jgi:PPM family protein phosphatase